MSNPAATNFTKNLQNIGTKLSDFEEVPSEDKSYSLLGKGNFGYAEKMKSKKMVNFMQLKKLIDMIKISIPKILKGKL